MAYTIVDIGATKLPHVFVISMIIINVEVCSGTFPPNHIFNIGEINKHTGNDIMRKTIQDSLLTLSIK